MSGSACTAMKAFQKLPQSYSSWGKEVQPSSFYRFTVGEERHGRVNDLGGIIPRRRGKCRT